MGWVGPGLPRSKLLWGSRGPSRTLHLRGALSALTRQLAGPCRPGTTISVIADKLLALDIQVFASRLVTEADNIAGGNCMDRNTHGLRANRSYFSGSYQRKIIFSNDLTEIQQQTRSKKYGPRFLTAVRVTGPRNVNQYSCGWWILLLRGIIMPWLWFTKVLKDQGRCIRTVFNQILVGTTGSCQIVCLQIYWHREGVGKWTPFCRRYFQSNFLCEDGTSLCFDSHFAEICSNGSN